MRFFDQDGVDQTLANIERDLQPRADLGQELALPGQIPQSNAPCDGDGKDYGYLHLHLIGQKDNVGFNETMHGRLFSKKIIAH